METKIGEAQKAYEEILAIMRKYEDVCDFNIEDFELKAKNCSFVVELKEKFGIDIYPREVTDTGLYVIDSYRTIGLFGEKYKRTILCSDDGRQSEDELLFEISFTEGPYIFGEDYPVELFREFFSELKSYKPKYIDSINNRLYFSMENASKVFNAFPEILKKYQDKYEVWHRKKEIERLRQELSNLLKKEENEDH